MQCCSQTSETLNLRLRIKCQKGISSNVYENCTYDFITPSRTLGVQPQIRCRQIHSSRPRYQITTVKKSTIKVSCLDLLSELHVIKLSLISIKAMSSLPELTFVGLRLYWSFELSRYKEINRTIEGGVQHSLAVTQKFIRIKCI